MKDTDIIENLTGKLELAESDKITLISTLQNLLSNHSKKSIADAKKVLNQFSAQQ
ncbi:hypothetical protein [Vibrio salinus]|uniref:hypothetical protein n=1 Tax=Vibrio salinus TaxID=2899784 RepID=UPI001E39D472|nr:hypothetical protein [Vibrio salinus]MCE0495740.1 hypothetical protein [Vibrio salinus]